MQEEPFPYNQPPWRRSYDVWSPDGRWRARIDNALEISMSGPTKGILSIDSVLDIPDCNPAFVWSEDSRFLAVPQWKYSFRKRERLLVVDLQTKAIFVSPSQFRLLDLRTFSSGVITGVDSIIRRPRKIAISLGKVMKEFKKTEFALLSQ